MATSVPVIWHFLGYPFEAAGMFAALFGCFAARFWIGAAQAVRQEHRWSLDIPVSGMALAVSAAIVISQRPEPLSALMYGAGLGILGEGIFKIAEKYLQKPVPYSGSIQTNRQRNGPPRRGDSGPTGLRWGHPGGR
ncbi:hypothetical protein QP162_20155 [Sphingomonas aurantiaca]|uniref:hypothetical protein n=1 Tax=Sphingomonas aurantiaca TaxID=185949 RepID=UPI002FE3233C